MISVVVQQHRAVRQNILGTLQAVINSGQVGGRQRLLIGADAGHTGGDAGFVLLPEVAACNAVQAGILTCAEHHVGVHVVAGLIGTGGISDVVLENISFDIEKGRITALLGSNGAGKTTLLRLMSGIKKPISGKVKVNGRCAVLPQNPMALLSQISVEEELASAVMDKGNVSVKDMDRKQRIEFYGTGKNNNNKRK